MNFLFSFKGNVFVFIANFFKVSSALFSIIDNDFILFATSFMDCISSPIKGTQQNVTTTYRVLILLFGFQETIVMVFYCTIKSSWVISHVKIELHNLIFWRDSVFIIRVNVMNGMTACYICTFDGILLYFSSVICICLRRLTDCSRCIGKEVQYRASELQNIIKRFSN